MLPPIFPLRNSIWQRVRGILTVVVLFMAAFLVPTCPALAAGQKDHPGKTKETYQTLENEQRLILGGIEVHLVFTDADGKEQDYSLAEAPPDFLQKLTPAMRLEAARPLLKPKDPKVGFFDALWHEHAPAVCQQVVASLKQSFPAGASHEAYDATCRPFKYGSLYAVVYPKVKGTFANVNSMGVTVEGDPNAPQNPWVRQLQIEFYVPPLSIVPFRMTTPYTCHEKKGACDADPHFTMMYDLEINLVANSLDLDAMRLSPASPVHPEYYVQSVHVVRKAGSDIEKQIVEAEVKIAVQLAVDLVSALSDDGLSFITIVVQVIQDLVKYGLGGLIDNIGNEAFYHQIAVGGIPINPDPTPVVKMANRAAVALNVLFAALNSGINKGFTKLDVERGPKHNLIFKLTYPAPAKTGVSNVAATQNAVKKKIPLSPPFIGTPVQQVKAGFPVMVHGHSFPEIYTNDLEVAWGKTVSGPATTQVEWGPKGNQTQNKDVVKFITKFRAPNLKPATTYEFRVHECDPISCAPWSDSADFATQAGGSNEVTLWLDNDLAQPLGTATLLPNGSFATKVTIPANTAAGKHTINASTGAGPRAGMASVVDTTVNPGPGGVGRPTVAGEKPQASYEITVVAPGGATPTISILDPTTRIAAKAPVTLYSSQMYTVRGARFAANGPVSLHLDTATGPKLGSATTNKVGMFQATFRAPVSTVGAHQLVHQLVAIQQIRVRGIASATNAGGERTLQATEEVNLLAQPK